MTREEVLNGSEQFIAFETDKIELQETPSNINENQKHGNEFHPRDNISLKTCIDNLLLTSSEKDAAINHFDSELFVWGSNIQVS